MRLKLSLLFVLIITFSWSQTTKTFNANGTFPVPAGVSSINVQAWGGGGSGGGASGAPLLLGRGAAGGGGGAFASAPVSVTGGTTLNVVVANQTSGTNGNGIAGGNSTITGFESSILAAGGSGGAANSAGGTPVGGIGGTVAASVGSTKFAGANGGNGNSWNLLGLLLSSGAGGNGANSGGAGGAAVAGLIFSNAPGNGGSAPGGAGSGGINSALGAAQSGGAGAAGRVIISYTCSAFSVSSTAATNVCASTGSTSTVTLTSSAASLPVGNYVVTYDRSSPSASALTANLTVSTAGAGTFTAVGLTTVGSSIITITKLTSETCFSNITTNNTSTVIVSPATVGGTVSGSTTINAGSPTGFMTLSGHTGSVLKWQSSVSPFTTWTDLPGTQNVTSLYFSTLSVTTQYRAVVQSGACSIEYSAAATITVNPKPTINLASVAIGICSFNNGSPLQSLLGYSGTTGSPTTYSIVWNSSPVNSFTPIIDAALTSSPITLFFPGSTAPGTYSGTLTVKNASGGVSVGSVFSVTIDRVPSITTTGTINSVISSTNSQTTSLSYSAATDNPTKYSIDWNSAANTALLTDQSVTLFAFSSGGGIINNIVIPANVPAGTYSGTIRISNDTNCSQSSSVSVVVNPEPPTITIAASTNAICSSATAQNTLLSYSATSGSPITYSIVWNSSPTNNFEPVVDAALPANEISIAVPAGITSGSYIGTLTVKNANGVVSPGYNFEAFVNESPAITTNGEIDSVCASNDAQVSYLDYSDPIGNPTSYSIDWDSAANAALLQDVPNTSYTFDTNGGSIEIGIAANVLPGTYSGILNLQNAICLESQSISITVIPGAVGGTVTGGTTIGSGSTSGLLTLSGQTGTVVAWESSVSPFTEWTEIENTDITYTSGPLTETTQFRAIVRKGLCPFAYSEPTTVTVEDLPTITLSDSTSEVCVFGSDNGARFQYSATTGNPVTYSVVWNPTPINNFVPVTDAVLEEFAIDIPIPNDAAPGTYQGTLTVKNANGLTSDPVAIVVKTGRFPGLTTNGVITTVSTSASAQTTTLEYSDLTGPPIAYSINWNNAANAALLLDQPSTPFTDTSGDGVISTIAVPANVPPGTYTGKMSLEGVGGCISLETQTVTLKINPAEVPTIDLAEFATDVCSNTSAQTTQISYKGTTGSPTTYSVVWNSSPTNNFVAVTDAALPSSPITIAIPAGVTPGTYSGTLTVKTANGSISVGSSFDVVVNQSPSLTTGFIVFIAAVSTSSNLQYTSFNYAASAGNPTSYYIDWDSPANTSSLANQASTPFAFASGGGTVNNVEVSANAQPGTYRGVLTIVNNFSCTESINISLRINSAQTVSAKDNTTQIVQPVDDSAQDKISVFTFNKVINIETLNQNIDKVLVYDASGNLVYKKDAVGNSKLSIDNLRPDNQVLVVKVILDNNQVKTKKVIY